HQEMRALLAQLLGHDPAPYPVGRMTYDLRRLRLHGLIQRIPKSHRYEVTPAGLRIALVFSRTYARLLRPKLAEIMPVGPPADSTLRVAFDRLQAEIDRCCEEPKTRRLPFTRNTKSGGDGAFQIQDSRRRRF